MYVCIYIYIMTRKRKRKYTNKLNDITAHAGCQQGFKRKRFFSTISSCVRGVFEIFDFCRPRAVLTEQLVISADDLLNSEIRLRRIATYAAKFASSPVFIDMPD